MSESTAIVVSGSGFPSEKRCRRCGDLKLRSEFHNHKLSKDLKYSYCKMCKNAENGIRQRVRFGHDLQRKITSSDGEAGW